MNILDASLDELMQRAAVRGERLGRGNQPAAWYYPANHSKAATVLMVHGFRGDHHGLMAIAAALPDYNVLIPDLPGYGKSVPLEEAHTVENYGAWLMEYAQRIAEQHGPLHLIAHSFGTQIVSEALRLGLRPASLTMLNPITEVAAKSNTMAKRLTTSVYFLATKLGVLGSAMLRSWIAVQLMSSSLALTKDRLLRQAIHRQHHRYFSNYSSDRVIIESFRSANLSAVTSENLPTNSLVIVGENDIVAPLGGQLKLVSGRPDLALVVLPGAGHLIHYEQPTEVADVIRRKLLPELEGIFEGSKK